MRGRKENGITLIALIITIIVLLILAVVSIRAIVGDGIIAQAESSKEKYEGKQNEENTTLQSYEQFIKDNLPNESGTDEEPITVEAISIETDCIRYYADVNGDKEPDGIIYVDKANTTSGAWLGTYSYTITNVTTGLKDYYICKESHTTEQFGTAPVLAPVPKSKGEERFYVMALEDLNGGQNYCWYDAAASSELQDLSEFSSMEVGSGRINSSSIIEKWNKEQFGKKNNNQEYLDVWGHVCNGWFVPSVKEWLAFAVAIGVTPSNLETMHMQGSWWTSCGSQDSFSPYFVCFDQSLLDFEGAPYSTLYGPANGFLVRLSCVF